MAEQEQHPQNEPAHKWRVQGGFTPNYKAFDEVYITRDLGSERNEELKAFINKHICEFKGKAEEKHGIQQMLFERKLDAQKFVNELSARLDIQKNI
jgi:hypothetical protein